MTGRPGTWPPPRVAVVGGALVVHALLPDGAPRDALFVAIGAVCVVSLSRTSSAMPAGRRRAWWLLTLGLAAWVAGDLLWTVLDRLLGTSPFPSVADVAYVASYPLLALGMVRAFPAPSGRRPVWLLDALLVTGGAVLLLWLAVLEPALTGLRTASAATLVGALYPLGDVLLLVVLARTATASGRRTSAHLRASWAVLLILAADVLFQIGSREPSAEQHLHLLDTLWLAGYVLLVAAGRHPSAASEAPARPSADLGVGQIVLVAASCAVVPVTLVAGTLSGGPLHLVETCVVGTAMMTALLVRFGGLVRALSRQNAHLAHLTVTDPLTGLANTAGLAAHVERPAADAPSGTVPVLLLVSLDGYRDVVETLGYGVADDLLVAVARLMDDRAPEGASIARLGRDVYAVTLDVATPAEGCAAAHELRDLLAAPVRVRGMDLPAHALVGVALAPARPASLTALIADADAALAAARRRPERVACAHCDGGGEAGGATLPEADLLRGLAAAVERGELVVHFQPVVAVRGARVTGAEALVRWQHPQHGLLGPAAFIPAAERTGLVRPVTLHVLDVALARCAQWRQRRPDFVVGINISAQDLDDPRLVDDVRAALDRHGLPPQALTLEVTETMAMRDGPGAERTLRELAATGVFLAVDDYGVGYGSLDYLRRLPFTVLKVDRVFVSPAAADPVCAEILRSTVDLGHALGMHVVAEGVEDSATGALLQEFGCDLAQGWAFGRPEPAEEFEARLAVGSRTAERPAPSGRPGASERMSTS
ncbi:bifunctional diguanylate cyclase/phosphodiesterase [Cellulomonas sp. C5510]|uniref:putative bifunctional diguanylate cyclase/phosphodiesterase n=1 Tax=Cellulomonas sp. C5510 TaxID=2871170 RepID=UPI001C983668|nr:bifunctional diguanylate cyclase/phosphodiesterase [Cellulomonas sp. C5510]QZN86469.1 bifunctional diguanylate cyclase/phosphodiesterase [Cellulomonas sp. C5510]